MVRNYFFGVFIVIAGQLGASQVEEVGTELPAQTSVVSVEKLAQQVPQELVHRLNAFCGQSNLDPEDWRHIKAIDHNVLKELINNPSFNEAYVGFEKKCYATLPYTLVAKVIRDKRLGVLELFLQKGLVDFKRPCDGTRIPLGFAATFKDFPEAIEMLLKYTGDVNERDPEGETPLMRAANVPGNLLVPLLVHHGADATLKTEGKYGRTARYIANTWINNDFVVSILATAERKQNLSKAEQQQ